MFKIGDKVRLLSTPVGTLKIGDICVVRAIDVRETFDGYQGFYVEGQTCLMTSKCWELASPPTREERIAEQQALVEERERVLAETKRSLEEARKLLDELNAPEPGAEYYFSATLSPEMDIRYKVRAVVDGFVWWYGSTHGDAQGRIESLRSFSKRFTRCAS